MMFKRLAFCVGFLAMATTASAAPLTLYNFGGGWSNEVNPTGACVDFDNEAGSLVDSVIWNGDALVASAGQPGGDTCGIGNSPTSASGYSFDPIENDLGVVPTQAYAFPTPDVIGQPFSIGAFTHNNFIIEKAIGGVTYNLGFSYSLNGTTNNLSTNLVFTHVETPNDGNCAAGPSGPSTSICDDFVNVDPTLNQVITAGGETYFFSLLGFSNDGGQTFNNTFQSPENLPNSAQLYGVVTTAPVPEPTTLLLLGTGLAGLAAARRRNRSRKRQ